MSSKKAIELHVIHVHEFVIRAYVVGKHAYFVHHDVVAALRRYTYVDTKNLRTTRFEATVDLPCVAWLDMLDMHHVLIVKKETVLNFMTRKRCDSNALFVSLRDFNSTSI